MAVGSTTSLFDVNSFSHDNSRSSYLFEFAARIVSSVAVLFHSNWLHNEKCSVEKYLSCNSSSNNSRSCVDNCVCFVC